MAGIDVRGTCDERFDLVKETFARHFFTGEDVGASFAVFLDGKPVVDIWAGFADAAKTRPWEKDTLVCVFSSTKVMAAICVHVLADRGLVDYDAPVAKYWPGFARAGKENVLVRHILSHTSGVSTYPEQVTIEELANWEKMVDLVERQPPLWPPGTAIGYEMTSFSFLVGELVRRVSGKSIGTFFRDEIARPLGADFHIGTPETEFPRLAELIAPRRCTMFGLVNSDFLFRLLGKPTAIQIARNPKIPVELIKTLHREPRWQKAELPSSNGNGNARSMAKIGAMIACDGELNGKRLLSTETIKETATSQFNGKGYLIANGSMGLGWAINTLKMADGTIPLAIGWGGLGGSFCTIDLDNHMSFAYAMNKMNLSLLPDRRKGRLVNAVYSSLKRIKISGA
nr:serine hydrolase domain-containing protein [Candidatus Sigynarchaeum springense]